MRFDSWGDFRYRRTPADDRGPASDLQEAHGGRRETHKHLNRVRVWWSDVVRHPLHLIKQPILLRKDFGIWFTRRVTDITWSPRHQRLSLHSPRRSRLMSRFDEHLRPRLQSDNRVPIFTCWCALTKTTFLKRFKQVMQIRVGADSFETVHHQHLRQYQNNINSVTVCVCVFSSRIWPWGFVCDGSWLSHKSKPAFSSLIFTSTADYRIKDKVYIWWQEQSAILLQKNTCTLLPLIMLVFFLKLKAGKWKDSGF